MAQGNSLNYKELGPKSSVQVVQWQQKLAWDEGYNSCWSSLVCVIFFFKQSEDSIVNSVENVMCLPMYMQLGSSHGKHNDS